MNSQVSQQKKLYDIFNMSPSSKSSQPNTNLLSQPIDSSQSSEPIQPNECSQASENIDIVLCSQPTVPSQTIQTVPSSETDQPSTSQPNSSHPSAVQPNAVQTNASQPMKKRKSYPVRSVVWDHYNKFTSKEGSKMASCKYCEKAFSSDPKMHGTTSLKNHLSKCSKNPHNIETKQAQLIVSSNSQSASLTALRPWKFDQNKVRKSLAAMIIMDELPFKFVQGAGFKKFMADCCPMFQIPSRWTVARDCFQFYLEEKKELQQFFKNRCQRICLTADTWTSIQRINYICITGHFIDENWKLHKRVLNFSTVFSHKGELVGQQIESCLSEWGISDVFTLTLDNASSNNGIITFLQRKFAKRGGSVLDAKFLHIRCIAHIINLIVQDGIKEVSSSINKIRAAVRFVRQSPARLQKFKKCAEFEKIETECMLCLDVSTRWNSTYLMLSVATKYERAFERYDESEPYFRHELEQVEDGVMFDGVPTENDWANARRLVIFLQKFYEMTLRISGSLYITSNIFFS